MKRLPPSPFAPTMIAVLMMCATLLFSLNASAQTRGFDVQMDTLSVERDGSQLIITYQVDARDWRALQQARIQPRLNVYLPDSSSRDFEFVQALRMDSPRGQATLNLGRRASASHAELRLVGTQGPNTITTMRLAQRRPAQTLRLPIVELRRTPERPGRVDRDDRYDRDDRRPPQAGRPQRPGPPPHAGRPGPPPHAGPSRPAPTRPGASRADIINACGQQSPFSSQVSSCIENASQLPPSFAVETIRACGEATSFSSDFDHCLTTAAAYRTPPAPAIRACSEATRFSSDFRSCVSTAAGFRNAPAEVIRACGNHTRFSSDFQQCLDASRA